MRGQPSGAGRRRRAHGRPPRRASRRRRRASREHPAYLGRVEGGGHRWASFAPADDSLQDERVDPIQTMEARCFLARSLERLQPPQRDALLRWLQRESPREISAALGLADAAAATRLVRAALDRLRRAYATAEAAPDDATKKSTGASDETVENCI